MIRGSIAAFARSDKATTAIEYGLIAAVMALALAAGGISGIGASVAAKFEGVIPALQ